MITAASLFMACAVGSVCCLMCSFVVCCRLLRLIFHAVLTVKRSVRSLCSWLRQSLRVHTSSHVTSS